MNGADEIIEAIQKDAHDRYKRELAWPAGYRLNPADYDRVHVLLEGRAQWVPGGPAAYDARYFDLAVNGRMRVRVSPCEKTPSGTFSVDWEEKRGQTVKMAPRIGYTMEALRRLQSTACESDIRVAWRDGERLNLCLVDSRTYDGTVPVTNLPSLSGPRELRLLALQLLAVADDCERDNSPDPHEVIL